jgi:hypothetical protein
VQAFFLLTFPAILFIYLSMGKKPDKAPPEKIKLVDLPRTLSAFGVTATYNQCYSAAINGSIPAERTLTGARWVVDKSQLPSVIAKFSLMKEPENGES